MKERWCVQMTRRFALRQILARKQSFYKLLASFFVMLILPLVLVLANYFYARGLLQQENINYQNAVLTQAQMSMDERLQTIQLYAIDLSNDTVLNATLSQRQADDSQGNFELWELSRHLQSYSATAGSFCDTTIYSRLYDCMVSGSYVNYRVSEGSLRMPSEEMNRSLLELLQNERSYCQFYLLGDSQGHSQLVMLHSVPLWSSGAASYGTICLRIDGDGLFSTIRDMEELQSGLVCLLDPSGTPAVWAGSEAMLDFVPQVSGQPIQDWHGASYTVSRADSNLKGWSYLSIQPVHRMQSELRVARNLSLLALALVLVVGAGIVYYLTWRNYRPVEHLLAELRRRSVILESPEGTGFNEFRLIEKSVADMQHSMKEVQEALRQEIPRIQESILLQLLKNDVSNYETYRKLLEEVGILFPYQQFRVVLARQVPSESRELSEQALTNIVLRDQLSQLVPGDITYTAVTLDNDSIVWILNGSGARFDQDTQDILGRLQDTMREQYGQLLWLYVSWIDQGLESVPQGYYAVTQTQAQQPGGGIRYLQKEKDVWPMDRSLNSIAAQLQNFIATGDAAQASALLHENLDANLRRRTVELYQAQGYCIGMLNIILEAYRVEDPAVLRVEGASPLQQIFQRRNINELEELLQTLICQLCHYVEENRTSPASQLIQKIQAYMQENYGDVDLTLTRVADQFNLTPNYLSIFFKENAHDTFLNYLTRLRLEEAKRLMRDTHLSITEISERVGYASANSFTRAFKKIEHVTPTQYRESSVHS